MNGEPVTLWAKATLLYDKNGNVAGAIESVRDITAQKRAEKALRSAVEYRRSLIEAHIDPLVTIGPDRRVGDVNAATEALTGLARETLIGAEFSSLFTDPGRAEEAYQRAVADGTVREYALAVRRSDGDVQPVLFYATVYRGADGEMKGVFAELHEPLPGPGDAGVRRTATSPILKLVSGIAAASAASGSAEEFLEGALGVLQGLPRIGAGCIALYGGDGTIRVVGGDSSGRFDEILSSFRGPAASPAEAFAGERRDESGNPVLFLPLGGAETIPGFICLSVQIADPSAYEVRAALELSATVIGAFYTQMLRTAAGEEAERIATLHLDIMAHDLTNAISIALGYAGVLDGMLGEEAVEIAEKMACAMRKGQEVIRNLKAQRTIHESRGGPAMLKETPLDPVIRNEISHVPGIGIDYAGCESVVLADDLVGEIFWNLIDNSVKYGGREVSVRIEVRETDDRVEIDVEDTGPGFSEEVRAVLASGVHGHGLCIVRDLAACYGGEVRLGERVAGRPEDGAAVRVTLRKAKVAVPSSGAGVSETRA